MNATVSSLHSHTRESEFILDSAVSRHMFSDERILNFLNRSYTTHSPTSTSSSSSDCGASIHSESSNDIPPPLLDSDDSDFEVVAIVHDDEDDDSDSTDNSDVTLPELQRVHAHTTRSLNSTLSDDMYRELSEEMYHELNTFLRSDRFHSSPAPPDTFPPRPLTPENCNTDVTPSIEYAAVNTVISLRNIVRDPVVRDSVSGVNYALSVSSHRSIIADSGATKSMFSDSSLFTNYRRVTGISVRMAGGALEQVIGMGDVGPLKDVLHVPNLVFDLESEPMLAKQGMRGEWADNWKTIRTRDGELFLVAHLNSHNLYEVNPMYLGLRNPAYNYECYEAHASKVEAIDLLHRTWGHISLDRLQAGINSRHIHWSHPSLPVNFRKLGSQCVVCALGKSKRRTFAGPIHTVSVPASHFYMDVWGPAECPSLVYLNVYMIGFIDAATKYL